MVQGGVTRLGLGIKEQNILLLDTLILLLDTLILLLDTPKSASR